MCWNDKEVSPDNNQLVCDSSISGIDWADYSCNPNTHYWTNWTNLDTPDGDGDLELFTLLNKLECAAPTKFEVKTVSGLSLAKAKDAGQVFHLKESCFGFMCLNKEQKDGKQCLDYHYKHCCPK